MTRVLIILVKGHAPRHLLRRRIDLDRAPKLADRCQHLPSDLTDRSVSRTLDAGQRVVGLVRSRGEPVLWLAGHPPSSDFIMRNAMDAQ